MVFATEFDPTHQNARQNARQNVRLRTSPTSGNASSSAVAFSAAAQEAANRVVKSDVTSSVKSSAKSNVVPMQSSASLNIGHPARRVRLDENKSLSLPKRPKLPLRLQLLTRFQQASTVVTTLLVTGVLWRCMAQRYMLISQRTMPCFS